MDQPGPAKLMICHADENRTEPITVQRREEVVGPTQ
jgi:hypothetical protein